MSFNPPANSSIITECVCERVRERKREKKIKKINKPNHFYSDFYRFKCWNGYDYIISSNT